MLKVDNLTFEVNEEGRKRCLVNHVSFQVADGEMLVITGPNGGGKSTLAKVLAGIEKADEGRINCPHHPDRSAPWGSRPPPE